METIDSEKAQMKGDASKHLFANHPKMMVFCCGIPLISYLAFSFWGYSSPWLGTILLLICPLSIIVTWLVIRVKPNKPDQISYGEKNQDVEEPADSEIHIGPVDPKRLDRRRSIQKPLLYPRKTRKYRSVVYVARISSPD